MRVPLWLFLFAWFKFVCLIFFSTSISGRRLSLESSYTCTGNTVIYTPTQYVHVSLCAPTCTGFVAAALDSQPAPETDSHVKVQTAADLCLEQEWRQLESALRWHQGTETGGKD